ncbi:RNA-directed DNA polymerase [Erwinia sp. CPCC 100877]|nr:RNA-directed DNA polymerase [Erwinia sp. CPCC 100877]
MSHRDLWKYCTPAKNREFLLSLQLLGQTELSDAQQISCLYSLSNHLEAHYRTYFLIKRNGSKRKISAPDLLLKKVQKNILTVCLTNRTCSPYATAYRKGVQLLENATPHLGQKQLLKLDIEDFFGSITVPMIARSAFPRTYFPSSVAGLLTQLCAYDDCLPQGAPTSPLISNLVMKPFDDSIGQWCAQRQITYTRFCDDLTFSGDFAPKEVKKKVQNFLFELGFTLNKIKTKQLSASQRQSVTGIVVNTKAQVPRSYRKKLRQEIYYCLKFGVRSHLIHQHTTSQPVLEQEEDQRYLQQLIGKTNFILQVNPSDQEFLQAKKALKELLQANYT